MRTRHEIAPQRTLHDSAGTPKKRLEIDWTRCDGHGLCAELLPERITRDEWGFPLISAAPVDDGVSARRTVAACPALALRLENS